MSKNSRNIRSSSPTAFSLIELAIVLIIMGLLIGGVIGGGELIRSAELRAIMTEARSYSVAVKAFFVQYDEIPGDNRTDKSSSGYFGNGDFKIQYQADKCNNAGNINNCRKQSSESFGAFHTLGKVGIIDNYPRNNNYTAFGVIGDPGVTKLMPGTHFPSSKRKGLGWMMDNITVVSRERNVVFLTGPFPVISDSCSIASTISNSQNIGCGMIGYNNGRSIYSGYIDTNNPEEYYNGLTSKDAFLIDTKSDDGNPETGKVTATTYAPTGDVTYQNSCYDNSSKKYTKLHVKSCITAYIVDHRS